MPNTLQAFLVWAGTTGGATALTYLVIELLDKYLPAGLTGNQKFYASFVLAITVPVLAYLGTVGLGYTAFTADGLWASILVTIFLAQSVHRQTSLAAAATPVLTTLESVAAPLLVPAGAGYVQPSFSSVTLESRPTGNIPWAPPPPPPPPPPEVTE